MESPRGDPGPFGTPLGCDVYRLETAVTTHPVRGAMSAPHFTTIRMNATRRHLSTTLHADAVRQRRAGFLNAKLRNFILRKTILSK